jgi:hypothetical protein
MNETGKQFSFTRAASSTSGRAKNQIPIIDRICHAIALLVIVTTALTGCGKAGSPFPKSPGEVVRAFYLAANDGKYSEAEALLAKEARDTVNGPLGQMDRGLKGICDNYTKNGNILAVDLLREDIRGEGATVIVSIRFKDGTVSSGIQEVILRGGKWQLSTTDDRKGKAAEAACINNLRQIDGAIQMWGLEKKKPSSAMVTQNDIKPYLRGTWPICPAGGIYTIGSVSTKPKCSIPGHILDDGGLR